MHLTVDIEMEEKILQANTKLAEMNRRLLRQHGVRAYDFMGAIGSGKTALIERISSILMERGLRVGAVTGDVAGDDDARRLKSLGLPVVNVNTGKECHLDAHYLHHALEELPLDELDIVFVENVGNLVCPADFPLGTDMRVVVVSVTEGDDMVRKHPVIFGISDVAVVNKIDIAEHVGVDPKVIVEDFRRVKPGGKIVLTSARTGEGIEELMRLMGL